MDGCTIQASCAAAFTQENWWINYQAFLAQHRISKLFSWYRNDVRCMNVPLHVRLVWSPNVLKA